MKRIHKGIQLILKQRTTLTKVEGNVYTFQVKGDRGDIYIVTYNMEKEAFTCNKSTGEECPDIQYREVEHCKHIYAVIGEIFKLSTEGQQAVPGLNKS